LGESYTDIPHFKKFNLFKKFHQQANIVDLCK
jgi:hypothetical protein